ncbi:MAG: c-type cytochrome [Polyangiaceae bacterium]|nr:c-type cytochrome [Polyangiaceae bacterium]
MAEGAVRQGSSVALARKDEALYAYIADPDAQAIHTVDLTQGKPVASTAVEGTPEQLVVLEDGRVIVTLSDKRRIEVFEPGDSVEQSLTSLCERETPAGPFALALSPDGGTLAVTSTVAASVSFFETASLRLVGASSVPRSPRGVLFAGDNKVFVSHVAGAQVSVVEPSDPAKPAMNVDLRLRVGSPVSAVDQLEKPRTGSQAYTLVSVTTQPAGSGERKESPPSGTAPPHATEKLERIVVPMVSVDPGDTGRRTQFYYGPPPSRGVPKQAPVAAVIDPYAQQSLSTHVLARTGDNDATECALPRAAAFRASTGTLYVVCRGNDLMLELDARSADPMRAVRRRWPVPPGPSGVAIAEAEGRAIVFGAFHGQVASIALDSGTDRTIDIDAPLKNDDEELFLGRSLFYRTNDKRITADGVACASCHPDGGDDGVTWSTPEGPRQTLMLAGRLHGTAPYGWTRRQGTLTQYIYDTSARLGGGKLLQRDMDSLAKYLESMPSPPAIEQGDAAMVVTGMKLFLARGCAECHVGGDGTDNTSHTFEKMTPDPFASSTSAENGFDTPALRSVSLSAPYFHDGRYASLGALLADKKSQMGSTASLTDSEREALEAYLGSL